MRFPLISIQALITTLLLSLSLSTTPATAADTKKSTLYATHYNGHIYTLTLTHPSTLASSENKNREYTLNETQSLRTCGSLPSWLTLDSPPSSPSTSHPSSGGKEKILYCTDESGSPTTNGSLTALSVSDQDGRLTELVKVPTPGGGVYSTIYETENGGAGRGRWLAIAHYQGAALSTHSLPLSSQSASQIITYPLTSHGPNLPQQSTPHPHSAILDPTGKFLIICDLGSDVLRIYRIDQTSGELDGEGCPDVKVEEGSGPRHGVFSSPSTSSAPRWKSQGAGAEDGSVFYLTSELAGTVTSFSVSYPPSSSSSPSGEGEGEGEESCLGLTPHQTLPPYPRPLPDGATPSEIRLQDDSESLYVSIRSDYSFGGNDSIAMLDTHTHTHTHPSQAEVTFNRLSNAYGSVPRTMVIHPDGELVAIGDQASARVVIVERDLCSGRLGKMVAEVRVGEPGRVGKAEGLSSVIWGEEVE